MNIGSTPSLLPIGSKYKKESHFGLRKVMRFAPPDVSRESKSYPAMSALIPAWLQTLGKEMQSEHLFYTSVTLCNTLESTPFNTSSHVGITMVLDLDPDKGGGYYVMKTGDNTVAIEFHQAQHRPLILEKGYSFIPAMYHRERRVMILHTQFDWQAAKRSIFDKFMEQGYARARNEPVEYINVTNRKRALIGKAGFQGLRHIDVERFSKEAERATLNSVRTHPSKSTEDGSSYCEDASASIAKYPEENHPLIMRMMKEQDDLFKHAKSLMMRDHPDNKGIQGKTLAENSDDEDWNTSMIGNCPKAISVVSTD